MQRKLPVFICFFLASCISMPLSGLEYEDIKPGKIRGKIIVQWLEPDLFLFIPDSEKPFHFERANGDTITPGRMLTDGGSIPRPIWVLRNYSPWGFTPAFIAHDWLFHVQQCKKAGHEYGSLESAALVMAEIMKTMIATKKIDASALTVQVMHTAVISPPARNAWEKGACVEPPEGFNITPIRQFELNFDVE